PSTGKTGGFSDSVILVTCEKSTPENSEACQVSNPFASAAVTARLMVRVPAGLFTDKFKLNDVMPVPMKNGTSTWRPKTKFAPSVAEKSTSTGVAAPHAIEASCWGPNGSGGGVIRLWNNVASDPCG